MPSRDLDFPVFDADNHMYETPEAFTQFLPSEYDGLIKYVEVNGRTKIAVNNRISDYIPNPTFEVVAAPGPKRSSSRSGTPRVSPGGRSWGRGSAPCPGSRTPSRDWKLMDELGLDRALMWPTLASLLEERLRDNPPATHAVVHALNQWMVEHWSFDYEDRIFPVPVITMCIMDEAIKELEWVLERGARIILVRPAPVPGFMGPRSMALPEFDPFWAGGRGRHPGRACTPRIAATSATPTSGRASATARCCPSRAYRVSPPSPATRVVPSSTRWHRWSATGCAPLSDAALHAGRERQQLGAPSAGRHGARLGLGPEFLRRAPGGGVQAQYLRAPVPRGGSQGLIDLLGADRVLFGSDYPHPEGMADPITFVDDLEGLPEKDVELVMGGNLNRLMGFGSAAA